MNKIECDGSQVHPSSALPSIPCQGEPSVNLAAAYKAQRDALLAFIQNVPVKSGVCCCGDDIGEHGYHSNHSPVDQWDHSVESWAKDFDKFDKEATK